MSGLVIASFSCATSRRYAKRLSSEFQNSKSKTLEYPGLGLPYDNTDDNHADNNTSNDIPTITTKTLG